MVKEYKIGAFIIRKNKQAIRYNKWNVYLNNKLYTWFDTLAQAKNFCKGENQ